jgi:hypothetical protein
MVGIKTWLDTPLLIRLEVLESLYGFVFTGLSRAGSCKLIEVTPKCRQPYLIGSNHCLVPLQDLRGDPFVAQMLSHPVEGFAHSRIQVLDAPAPLHDFLILNTGILGLGELVVQLRQFPLDLRYGLTELDILVDWARRSWGLVLRQCLGGQQRGVDE